MKPPRFKYISPSSEQEAVAALAEYGDEAKVLAGGQSLIPMMNMRLARPAVLVDINRIDSLDYVAEDDQEGSIRLGALARQRALQHDSRILGRLPILSAAAEWMSHPQIRSRGTVLGSIVHGDPAAELPAVALVLEAHIRAVSANGERTIPATEFYNGYYSTELNPEELAVDVVFPSMPEGAGSGVHEVCRRRGDFALAGMVAVVRTDSQDCVVDIRLASFGFGGSACRLYEVEKEATGQKISDELIEHIGRRASESVTVDSDIHASAEYRKALADQVTRRVVSAAAKADSGAS